MTAISNIISNALRQGYASEMVHKVILRWRERGAKADGAAVRRWCADNSTDVDRWAKQIDAALWTEASEFAVEQADLAKRQLASIGVDLGGGGAYDLIYFLTRLRPQKPPGDCGTRAGRSPSSSWNPSSAIRWW